jgi:hypothetical protein
VAVTAAAEEARIETRLALMAREIEEIHGALYGNGDKKGGLIARVETLAETAERGRWALRTVLWIGGAVVAILTALGQMRTAWIALWGHGG